MCDEEPQNDLQSHIDNTAGESAVCSDLVIRRSLVLRHPKTIQFSYSDPTATSGRGTIHISSGSVKIEGLRFRGTILIDGKLSDVSLVDCVIFGNLKVGTQCFNVSIVRCALEPERGVAITVETHSSVRLEDCIISQSLVGISLTNEVVVAESASAFSAPPSPLCTIKRCRFDGNQTDIVVQMLLRSGTEPGNTAVLYPSNILNVSDISQEVKYEVSIGGRFEAPLVFKQWPVPLETLDNTQVHRRGFQSNGRFCHLSIDAGAVIVTEDAFVPGPERKRKRPVRTEKFSRAQIHYAGVLGVDPGCDKDAVLRAYKRLALQHHPDKTGGAEDAFISVKIARDELIRILDNS